MEFSEGKLTRLVYNFELRERVLAPYLIKLVHEDKYNTFGKTLKFVAPRSTHVQRKELRRFIEEVISDFPNNFDKARGICLRRVRNFISDHVGIDIQREPIPDGWLYQW